MENDGVDQRVSPPLPGDVQSDTSEAAVVYSTHVDENSTDDINIEEPLLILDASKF